MPIIWTNDKDMYNKTKECFNKFDNIQAFFDIQNAIYTEYWASKGEKFEGDNTLSFGDDQIDNIAYDSETKKATVRIFCRMPFEREFRGKLCKNIFFVFDFEDVEEFRCDIAPEYYIQDLYIQQDKNGRFVIEFEGVDLTFSFTKGKANRWWME